MSATTAPRKGARFGAEKVERPDNGGKGYPSGRPARQMGGRPRPPGPASMGVVGAAGGARQVGCHTPKALYSPDLMSPKRLEAFSDGVIAIIITIMVLELRPPDGSGFDELRPLVPKVLAYLLSFVLIAIYWNNHHHLFTLVERIDGAVMWSNMALLFSLSLVPFATAWFGENPGTRAPVIVYVVVQLACAASYSVMTRAMLRIHPPPSRL